MFICESGRKSKMEKVLAPIVKYMSKKFIYLVVEDNSNKRAERLICQNCYGQVGLGIPHPCT